MNRLLLLTTVLLLLIRCSSFVDGDPSVSFEAENVLRPKIIFRSNDTIEAQLEYWKEGSAEKRTSFRSKGISHEFILMNLTQETDYNYQIRSIADSQMSKTFSFRTGKIPAEILTVTKEKVGDGSLFSGYIFIRKFNGRAADILLNNLGDIVWYHEYGQPVRRQFTWTAKNTILSAIDTAHIVETDLYGNRLLDLDLLKAKHPLFTHHDILYDDEGNLVTVIADSILANVKPVPKRAYVDGIARFSKEGEVRWIWNVSMHLDVAKAISQMKSERGRISHANSLTIDKDGNYLVSFRDYAQVWKVNSTSGEVMWKLGKGGDIAMDSAAQFIGQHSIHLDENQLVIFDNGNPRLRPYSRIVAFQIDEAAKKARTEYIIDLPKEISSFRMGSAYKIGNNRFLVCTSSMPMALSIVDDKGKILWQVRGDQYLYRAYYVEDPFGQSMLP